MPAEPSPSENRRARLASDHQQIEELLVKLVDAFDSNDRDVATTAFEAFDRRLTAHLALEDELLPDFAVIDAAAAEQLTAEHRVIRARVDELGVADNLHLSRASAVRELVELLRRHVKREDTTLYAWADRVDDPTLRPRLDRIFQTHERSPGPPAP